MSKLQQLLETLCPDGVEYKMLGDVCTYKKGTSITKQQIVHGNIPVIAGGTTPAYYHNEYNREGETIAISSSGTAGYVSYWNEPVFLSDSFSVHPCELLTTKYIYFVNNQVSLVLPLASRMSKVKVVRPSLLVTKMELWWLSRMVLAI